MADAAAQDAKAKEAWLARDAAERGDRDFATTAADLERANAMTVDDAKAARPRRGRQIRRGAFAMLRRVERAGSSGRPLGISANFGVSSIHIGQKRVISQKRVIVLSRSFLLLPLEALVSASSRSRPPRRRVAARRPRSR